MLSYKSDFNIMSTMVPKYRLNQIKSKYHIMDILSYAFGTYGEAAYYLHSSSVGLRTLLIENKTSVAMHVT